MPGGTGGRWSGLLRLLGYLAYPVAAGAAFALLCLGVVTWLPALAATAHALHRWRRDGDGRCFVTVFTAFRRYLRSLLSHAVASTAVAAVLVANSVFLLGRATPAAPLLLAAQLGIAAVFVIYHLALAVVAGIGPDDRAGWVRAALAFGFGSPVTGTALLGAAIAAPVLSVVVPLGPVLLGPTLPLLVGLSLAARATPPARASTTPPDGGRSAVAGCGVSRP